MVVDILYQLFKGFVMNAKDWIEKFLKISGRQNKRWNTESLSKRFRNIPLFGKLRVFPNYLNVSQWTGDKQKALIKQLVPVLALMLSNHAALQYVYAVVDMVLLTQFIIHDNDTLQYINAVFYRIDKFKNIFLEFRPKKHEYNFFNYPKLHALTHYTEYIRFFGNAIGMNNSHFEAAHKYLIKAF
jgi:hypothetical protein